MLPVVLRPLSFERGKWRRVEDSNLRSSKTTTVFETAAFDRSANSPNFALLVQQIRPGEYAKIIKENFGMAYEPGPTIRSDFSKFVPKPATCDFTAPLKLHERFGEELQSISPARGHRLPHSILLVRVKPPSFSQDSLVLTYILPGTHSVATYVTTILPTRPSRPTSNAKQKLTNSVKTLNQVPSRASPNH